MNDKDLAAIQNQVKDLGFPERLVEDLPYHISINKPSFNIYYHKNIEDDQLMYKLNFSKGAEGHIQFVQYELTVKSVTVPDLNINGINTRDLDDKLKGVDKWYDTFLQADIETTMSKQEYEKANDFITSTNNELFRLAATKEGEEAARLLMYKYFPQKEYEKFFSGYKDLQQQYEHKQTFSVSGDIALTATDAYRCLKADVQNHTINNLSTIKEDTMNHKNFEYLRDQVKFTGFGEGLENELREKMQKQSPEFQLYHNVKFGNDVATATLHFKKSELSDMYFFNKYDVTLKQENNPDMMKQTFYINKGSSITLKEAYNLMSGRAINKDLTNKEGQVYNAWVQMDFKETDKNGNYQLKHYHQNYGFDLEKELAKHPIKELMNEQEKTRLTESLQKGNRQMVTFVKEGQEHKMFVEANPKFKAVNVYDSNGQRVQSQSQKEKNAPEQLVKQDTKKESRKQGADEGEGFAEPKQKRSRKKGQSIS